MFYRCLYKSINDLFIFKFYFLFCRVHIHIHLLRVKVNKKHIHRETVFGNHFLVGIHHCMIQIGAFNKAVVDEKILITSGFLSRFRLTHKTINVHVISFFFYSNQFCIVIIAQQLKNPLFHTSPFQVKDLLVVCRKRKKYMRKCQCYSCKLINNMPHLCIITFQKISAGRHIKE